MFTLSKPQDVLPQLVTFPNETGGVYYSRNERKMKIEKKNEQWKWLFRMVKFLGISAYLL